MRAPHLTTIAAVLMTVGGGVWATAMSSRLGDVPGGVICGLHQAAQPAVHCGWCYAALTMMVAGAGVLMAAGVRVFRFETRR